MGCQLFLSVSWWYTENRSSFLRLKVWEIWQRFKITSKLEQAVSFRTDPRKEDALYYLEGGEWDSIGAEDMEPLTDGDYEIKLDFSDTEPEMAAAWIIILYKGEEIHSRKIELPALWDSGKEKQGDMTDEKDLKQER